MENNYKDLYLELIQNIQEYKKIAIFRHIHPDFDALGAAFALKEFININFGNADVRVLGDNHDDFVPRVFPKSNNTPNDWFNEPFLAIVLDTPNTRRISDPRFSKASYIIKIDHHPFIEEYGDLEIIDDKKSSASELLADMLFSYKMIINKNVARNLYIGIVGDSGRFEYSNTSTETLDIASKLLGTGINIVDIYRDMYLRSRNDLRVMSFILDNYSCTDKGVAYFIFSRDDLKKFNITTNKAKDFVNLFHYVDGIKIWLIITADMRENCYRASIRSEKISIRGVCEKFGGGGHDFACGAKLLHDIEIKDFINALDELITD